MTSHRAAPRVLFLAVLVVASLLAACGGSGDDDAAEVIPTDSTTNDGGSTPADDGASGDDSSRDDTSDEGTADGDAPVADACSLLDADLLDDAFEGVESTFGGALDFDEPLQPGPSAFCSWPEASGGQSFSVTVEDAASAETDDHSGRAYNIDVEPLTEPQDGPGTKAVLLRDDAFADSGGSPITYGYFFVEGDVAVFIESTGFDAGADALRTLADEADARLLAR